MNKKRAILVKKAKYWGEQDNYNWYMVQDESGLKSGVYEWMWVIGEGLDLNLLGLQIVEETQPEPRGDYPLKYGPYWKFVSE